MAVSISVVTVTVQSGPGRGRGIFFPFAADSQTSPRPFSARDVTNALRAAVRSPGMGAGLRPTPGPGDDDEQFLFQDRPMKVHR
jgi:hypothetical protein